MSYPRMTGFKSFFDPPSLSDFLLLTVPYLAPKIWARRFVIASFVKRRIETIIITTMFAGLAALVSTPITVIQGSYGGNEFIGGTSTTITSRLAATIDLTFLVPLFIGAGVLMLAMAVIAEHNRKQRENSSLEV